ncbi:hypothetical protein JX266_013873 [Neoarthrinium moseri]|nr:hypothetical protein JX266_013873 [Neoarthrinium moseri]
MFAQHLRYALLVSIAILLLLLVPPRFDHLRDSIQETWVVKPGLASTLGPDAESSWLENIRVDHTELSDGSPALTTSHQTGTKHSIGKIAGQRFRIMADEHVPAASNEKIKMLEIGLGCDLFYGPGASYSSWLEYFPHVELYYVEYDSRCAETWTVERRGATIYFGDQADTALLQDIIDKTGGNFDIIVDHNGHSMHQKNVPLEMLWLSIKPGGMYFVEDLETTHVTECSGDASVGRGPKIKTMAKYVYEQMYENPQPNSMSDSITMEVKGIRCQMGICTLFKKELGGI